MIDQKDAQILKIIQTDGRAPLSTVARDVGMAPSAVHARLKRLQQDGTITGFTAIVNPARVGFGVSALVSVWTEEAPSSRNVGDALTRIPRVLEVHDVAGEQCYIARVSARDIHDLKDVVRDEIGRIPGIRRTSTMIILETLKQSHGVDVESALERRNGA